MNLIKNSSKMKKLLLLSNSTIPGEKYMQWTLPHIQDFMKGYKGKDILFIPYAGVSLSDDGLAKSYSVYEERVNNALSSIGLKVKSIHRSSDPIVAVKNADAVMVGGGNTFHLVAMLHKMKLIAPLRLKALNGMPFIGWSAGSNVACPTLRTTNDMPIIMPESFNCFNLIPFQINPHYLDKNPEGFGGETRDDRIKEFMTINKKMPVVGLREASLLRIEGNDIQLKGHPMRLFTHKLMMQLKAGEITQFPEFVEGDDISFLLK